LVALLAEIPRLSEGFFIVLCVVKPRATTFTFDFDVGIITAQTTLINYWFANGSHTIVNTYASYVTQAIIRESDWQ
jgi:hypothetical protein